MNLHDLKEGVRLRMGLAQARPHDTEKKSSADQGFHSHAEADYGGFLNFYPHLHCLVSAGGLNESRARWIHNLEFRKEEHSHELMLGWRFALVAYLHAAIEASALKSNLSAGELKRILEAERKRYWNIFVSRRLSKKIVIDHIGRYVRKPPIAQYRLTRLNDKEVQYLAKDTRNDCLTPTKYTNRQFLALLMPHIGDRYCNSMRYFGLLAPRSKTLLWLVFDLLKQPRKLKPPRLDWATSLEQTFGRNPLIGRDGSVLRRVGRIKPVWGA